MWDDPIMTKEELVKIRQLCQQEIKQIHKNKKLTIDFWEGNDYNEIDGTSSFIPTQNNQVNEFYTWSKDTK